MCESVWNELGHRTLCNFTLEGQTEDLQQLLLPWQHKGGVNPGNTEDTEDKTVCLYVLKCVQVGVCVCPWRDKD